MCFTKINRWLLLTTSLLLSLLTILAIGKIVIFDPVTDDIPIIDKFFPPAFHEITIPMVLQKIFLRES